MKRTNYCGLFSERDVGKRTIACGWVETKRDMGGVIFIDLVDREGVLQIVFNPAYTSPEAFALAERVRNQSTLMVEGEMFLRDEETVNTKIDTGTVELRVTHAVLLSACGDLPFNPAEADDVREDLRLKYRYLDLRRKRLRDNIRFRHRVTSSIRRFMDDEGFIDVETPILTKSTPEGARDYLVPSRVHPGAFYALPQSPQLFKQLLMVSGFDRYYQIARCFRDEDLRADRQPEFTQLDLEMSFVEMEDVLTLLENLLRHVMLDVKGISYAEPFPRFTWAEAMDRYGSDKPDLRFDLPIVDITDLKAVSEFSVFSKVVEAGGVVRAITLPGQYDLTRSTINELTDFAISEGAGGMAWIAWRPSGEIYSILTKYIEEQNLLELLRRVGAEPGDFVLFSADKLDIVRRVTGALRLRLGDMLGLRDPDKFAFAIVTDFPMFEYNEEEDRYTAQHHPFTMPFEEDFNYLLTDPLHVRSQAYDFVLNGTELGSGSIRIHRSDIQTRVFQALGLSDQEIEERFGFIINAFKYGAPPHGGFAFGLDRLVMILAGEQSLRDVIAFPKIRDASCPMTDAPSTVDEVQLDELSICLADAIRLERDRAVTKEDKHRAELNIKRLAEDSRLQISQKDEAGMQDSLLELISFADALHEVDTDGVKPTYSPSESHDVWLTERDDRALTAEDALANAPESRQQFFFVPPVVE
ncbi:MAG: aspartate--tRNA ligase [Saccharofermentanales bacterium]